MMRTTITLCLCFAGAQAFVAPAANTNRIHSSSLDMLAILNMLPTDVAEIATLPTELPFPMVSAEIPLPSDAVSEVVEELSLEVPAVVKDFSLPGSIATLLFGETDILEEEVTNGMTHALLDFGSFWSENAWLIKFLAFVGRIVVLGHSLIHGEVMPDELAFQLGFLGLSCHSLYQATIPKLEARKASIYMTPMDRLAFRTLFRSAGFSWQQFREIHTQSMEWVTVEAGETILDEAKDNAAFWLYQGEVHIKSEDKIVYGVNCEEHKKSGMSLFGEKRLAGLLDNSPSFAEDQTSNAKSYVAGEAGATLLRIDVPKLGRFLRHHDELTNNFGRLAFNAMQDKLNTLRLQTN